ncbi:MAG: Xaa-Pro peptidase family protein [Marivibrio sp.]|uniref:M24 family metallopeptidase n=1 Tax=Marivibrio sp. TaxID=2039719 RepID=UPI0032EDB5DB
MKAGARSEPPRGFARAEFEARTARAQARMAESGLDALLLTTEPEVRYFSGFLTRFWESPTRPWFLLVPQNGAPTAVIPGIGAECMARTWIEDVRTWSSPTPADEGLSLLAETMRERLGPRARIGLPHGPETHLRLPLADFSALRARLPGYVFSDDAGIVRRLRMIKSPAEREKIAHVCALVSGVFEAAPAWLAPGVSEREIFRRFKIACLEAGVDDVVYLVGGAGPGGYGDIISPPGDRALRAGDVLMLDTGCTFDGYFCDFDRNFALGAPDAAAKDAYALLFEATEAGFDAARPGARAADVFHAMNRVLTAGGAAEGDVGRMGHGLGMQLTEWPSHAAWDETEIEDGMILTLEPGMTLAPGLVMVHEENIAIEADGPVCLTRRAPKEMPVIPA